MKKRVSKLVVPTLIAWLFGFGLLLLWPSPALALPDEVAVAVSSPGMAAPAEDGEVPPVWLVIPFVALLLMIATGPLFYEHHWHHHYPKWAVGWGLLTVSYYVFVLQSATAVLHAVQEYLSFIALLASLFIASGCILIKMNAKGRPLANAVILLIGSVIANVIGTTGASMLLIRPYMRLNAGRLKAYHVIFFIFTVSNVGGALTPIGDPPLFLGFLRGVPFFWTVTHVWYIWLPTILALVGVFYVFDKRNKEESTTEVKPGDPVISITGGASFGWLALVILSVFIDPNVFSWVPAFHVGSFHVPFGIRELIMFAICYAAYRTANPVALRGNEFNFEPIREVAWLFIGIFLTMQPALQNIAAFANANADTLGVSTFYFGTGSLSAILDNAPTYVSFLSAAMGKFGMDVNTVSEVAAFAQGGGTGMLAVPGTTAFYLQSISVAAVFFGAMTYIGNGPNFMVKAIAESRGLPMPSFVGYLVRYALPILLPLYVLVWVVFYSGYVL